jgi:serine/threonine protein kinase/DNA-binding winged helix-turn-helix (wHTH) protein
LILKATKPDLASTRLPMISSFGRLFSPAVRFCPEFNVPIKDHRAGRVRFGAFEVDLRSGELYPAGILDDGRKTLLREQPFQVLRMLIEGDGKVVTREQIRKRLWPNETIVGFDHSINVAIGILRQTLGDSADNPQYIKTLARRGYRLIVPVEWQETTADIPKVEGLQTSVPLAANRNGGLTGTSISRYRVLEVLGGGGMGVVYRAEDLKLGRPVALKFLPEEVVEQPATIQRFEREAQTASALNHPNICTIHGIEEYEGKPFIVMELLEGEALSTRLARSHGPLALTTVLDVAIQVCSGLQAAHAKGIIHRDVKPANIFLTKDGPAKILDFGLAKLASSEEEQTAMPDDGSLPFSRSSQKRPAQHSSLPDVTNLTATGTALGTLAYMSPEQIRKEKLDARTDLFSFGLVLYEMATGRRAFLGESAAVVHEAILQHTPSSARELRPSVPRRLNEIISKALEKDRAQRYQSAMEMREDLLRAQKELRSIGGLSRNWLAIVASLLVLGTAGALFWRHHSARALSSSDTLVLADVTNETSDGALDEGLSFALLVALGQTPYLNLLGGDKLHETARRLGLSEDTKISPLVTPQVALQVCLKTNSRAVVSASIKDVGNRFRIVLSAIECQSGKTLEQEVHEAETRDDIVRTLGLSASQLRSSLGESRDSLRRFNQPLDQATSSSPEALQSLALGYEKQLRGDLSGAVSDYQRAEEKDPKFALAYAAHGSGLTWLQNPNQAVDKLSKAFELRDRLTIPSRFQVETLYYLGRREWDKACRVGQEWVQAFPRDVIARQNFSTCLEQMGRHDDELVQSREAARLLPSEPTLVHLLSAAIYAQRIDEAREAYDEAISRRLDSPRLHLHHALLAFLQNDTSGMQKEWAWAAKDPVRGRFVLYRESRAEGFYGRCRNAHQLAKRAVDASVKAGFLSDASGFESLEALSDAEIGNLRQSQALVTDAVRKSQDRIILILAAFTFARAGNIKQSQELMEKLNQLFPNDFTIQVFSLPATRAAIKLEENDPAAAIDILRPVTPYDLAFSDSFYYVYPAYLRGLAYLQLKQGDLAAAEFREVLDHSGVGAGFVTGALSILQLGRAQVLMHDKKAARKSYEDFLALWKNADSDLPIYKEAKAEYAALRKTGQ